MLYCWCHQKYIIVFFSHGQFYFLIGRTILDTSMFWNKFYINAFSTYFSTPHKKQSFYCFLFKLNWNAERIESFTFVTNHVWIRWSCGCLILLRVSSSQKTKLNGENRNAGILKRVWLRRFIEHLLSCEGISSQLQSTSGLWASFSRSVFLAQNENHLSLLFLIC